MILFFLQFISAYYDNSLAPSQLLRVALPTAMTYFTIVGSV